MREFFRGQPVPIPRRNNREDAMKIFFVNGIRGGDEVEFAIPEITIGREDDNVLRIPTAGVSRYHARIYRNTAGEWLVGDQGSTNGVKLNRSRIVSDTVLREGDLIEIGDQMIRVTELAAAPPKVIFRFGAFSAVDRMLNSVPSFPVSSSSNFTVVPKMLVDWPRPE